MTSNQLNHFFLCSLVLCLSSFFFSCENSTTTTTTDPAPTPTPSTETNITPAVEPRQVLETFGFADCKNLEDSGCSCYYHVKGGDNQSSAYFISDMDRNACIKVNGQLQSLMGRDAVYRQELREKVAYAEANKDWIVLPKEGPMLYFGAPVPEGQKPLDYIVHVLMMMDNIPAELPIRNEAEGMAIREVRDLAADAITLAKKKQAGSNYQIFEEDLYYNDNYQVIVDTKPITQNEGEADTYEGAITLKDKEGNILHTQPVSGTCGC